MVQFGKIWNITSKEDYEAAMKALDYAAFCANMADDHYSWMTETEEVEKQVKAVTEQAKALGLL